MVLVTGGCGFIGSHLADALIASGKDVTILDNLSTGKQSNAPASAQLVVGDVADTQCVSDLVGKADLVYHLAAIASVEQCERDAEGTHRTNFIGTKNILDAAAASPKKPLVVYASSAAVYGDNPNLPLSEDAQTAPLGNYGKDKLAGENYAKDTNIPSVGLRFFNVFGPRQDARSPYSGVISKFVERTLAEQPLTYFGDGEQTRDFIYVGDIVKLLLAAADTKPGTAMIANGCTGKATSLKQLVSVISEIVGHSPRTEMAAPRQGDIRHSLGNPAQAEALFGFKATTSLKEGLSALIYASQKEAA